MAARNTARKRAFQILFEGDQRGAEVLTVLADWVRLSRGDTRQPPVSEYTMELVEGYAQHAKRIDELLAQYSVGWTLDRMPVARMDGDNGDFYQVTPEGWTKLAYSPTPPPPWS
ncbi:transcription antitermination factor NusB, partial [Streptomyces chartreusis]|uniref:transcription antitermination factor NusB n=1 Tax=Streptomyces chartreusis TaxID=1969 RepID=UPI0033A00302